MKFLKTTGILALASFAAVLVAALVNPAFAANIQHRFDGAVQIATLYLGGTKITSTAAELNILDGVTSTAAELNILDTVTADATDLNRTDVTTEGTAEASKVLTADSSGEVTGLDIADASNLSFGGEVFIKHATADITSAELLALNATPITVISAPGAGKAITILQVCVQLDYATTAYDGIAAGEDLVLKYTDGSGDVLATTESTGHLDQSADTIYCVPGEGTIPVANAAVVAHMLTGEIATGDSPLDLEIYYTIVTTEIP